MANVLILIGIFATIAMIVAGVKIIIHITKKKEIKEFQKENSKIINNF